MFTHIVQKNYKLFFSTSLGNFVPHCNLLIFSVLFFCTEHFYRFTKYLQKILAILFVLILLLLLSVPDLLDNPSLHLVPMTSVIGEVLKCNML